MKEESIKILNRLKRLEGQIRGLQNMLQKEVPQEDILIQVKAAKSALLGIEELIVFSLLREDFKKNELKAGFIEHCIFLFKKYK